MKVKIHSINNILLFLIIFLTFLGFYAIILILVNAGMMGFTREVTIPVRAILGTALIGLFIFNLKKIKLYRETKWFLVFALLYIGRIIIDYYTREAFYLSTTEVLFYFLSFVVIPFISISTFHLNEKYLSIIINALIFSGFIFSILAFLFYGDFIGRVGRLSSSAVGEDVASPLILSYCSTLITGGFITYLLYNRTNTWRKLVAIFTIVLSIVPFFLGASRGSLIALIFPFLFLFVIEKRIKIKNIILLSFIVVGLISLDENLGSGLLNRFFNISEAIEKGSSSASRLLIWEASFNQFIDNPFFGDKLRVEYQIGYAHNLFVEVLQTMGLFGFIPFIILVGRALIISLKVFKYNIKYAWVPVIFIQALIQNSFSGAIYNAAWFWTSMAVVISLGHFLRKADIEQSVKIGAG